MDSNEGDASDPTKLFSYMNKRLENMLGQYRKDFELDSNGKLIRERLGRRGGMYGSFLPMYCISPAREVNEIQNPIHKPAMLPKPSVAPNGPLSFAKNPSVFQKPQNGSTAPVPCVNRTQNLSQKTCVTQNGPITIAMNPSVFSKPQNGPSIAAQNSSHKLVKLSENLVNPSDKPVNASEKPVKPYVSSIKPSVKTVKSSENLVNSSDKPAKLYDSSIKSSVKTVKPSENLVNSSDKPSKLYDSSVKPSDKTVKPSDKTVRPSDKPAKLYDSSVKPSDKTFKPSENLVNSSEKPAKPYVSSVKPSEKTFKPFNSLVNSSEKPAKLSDNSINEQAEVVRNPSPKPPVEKKRGLKIRIKVGDSLVKKEESKESSEISRRENEMYVKLGLKLSPSDDDESPDMNLKKVTRLPLKGKQILSPLKSKIANLSNKTTVSFFNKMKSCSKLSSPKLRITENGKKVNQGSINTNKERESIASPQLKVKEELTEAPPQVNAKEELIVGKKMMEFNARATTENGKQKVSDLKHKNGRLGLGQSSQFKVTDKKGPIICPKREIKKEKEIESIVGSSRKKLTAEREATRMDAPEIILPKREIIKESKAEDDWVECDKCKKWRMLPNSIRPDDLADKWVCSMITWLGAGMNSCNLSEEETTQALNTVSNGIKAVPKTGTKDIMRPAGSVPKNGTKEVGKPAGAVPRNGKKEVVKPAGAVPVTGMKDVMKPAGAVPKIGAEEVMPAGVAKANAKQYKDIQGPAQADMKLNKKRLMDQPADDIGPSKKPLNKPGNRVPEPAKKPRNKVSELATKLGNRVTEPATKPGNRVPEPVTKAGNGVREPVKKPGSRFPELATQPGNKVPEPSKKPAISKRPNGGGMFGSESSPKRRKMKEEPGPTTKKEKLAQEEKLVKTEPADVANRDSMEGPVQALHAEAQDFKHRADRLKKLGGMECESLLLYFHGGLKFLSVASFYEPKNLEGFKAGDADRSIQIYTETAQIFEYCAREYENANDKAGAALSYKCIEIALMKAAFLQQPSKLNDFQIFYSSLQMHLPGWPQGPSSNLENVHNVACTSNDIKSHNLSSSLKHLMNYTHDVNKAFEATQQCNEAFQYVKESEKNMIENCLNFAFGNTEGFVQLTQKTACSLER